MRDTCITAIRVVATAVLALLVLPLMGTDAHASRIEAQRSFSRHFGERDLSLSGVGRLKYRKLITVYDAALFVDTTAPSFQAAAKCIEVTYRMAVKAERQNRAGREILGRNLKPQEFLNITEPLTEMERLYPDFEKGDRCVLLHSPGDGFKLWHNGALLGEIADDDFAEKYLMIWLGGKPADADLRDALMAGAMETWPGEERR